MHDDLRDDIIDDLLKKVPDEDYADTDLFDLGFKTRYDVTRYLRSRFYDSLEDKDLGRRKVGLHSKSEKLWSLISSAVYRTQMKGGEGIYKVRAGYMDVLGFIYAEDKQQADTIAKMFFEYLLAPDVLPARHYRLPDNCTVEFVKFASVLDIPTFNNPLMDSIKLKASRKKEEYEHAKKEFMYEQAKLETVQVVQLQQLQTSIDSICTPEEEE